LLSLCFLKFLCLGGLSSFKVCRTDVLANGDNKAIAQGARLDLLPLESGHLGRKRSHDKVSVTQLTIEVGAPGVDRALLVDNGCKATLLLADLNFVKKDAVHADLLRSAEDAELTRAPHDQLA